MTTQRFDARTATALIMNNSADIARSNLPISSKVGEVADKLGFDPATQEADRAFVNVIVGSSTEEQEVLLRRLGDSADLAWVLLGLFKIRGLLPGILEKVYKPLWK